MPTFSSSSILQSRPQKHTHPAPTTNWIWDYFEVTPVDQEWIVKRTKKRELIDQDIQYAYIDNKTGIQCQHSSVESRILQWLQSQTLPVVSNINRYFNTPHVSVTDTLDLQ
jgi:hypothetical protein